MIDNLKARIQEAKMNGWLGEVQGLQVSLDAAATKLVALDRTLRRSNAAPVELGTPIITNT